eukprot:TRINITY_DN5689_c0_g1_i2.p1 TRINITY_DN5689_c0_g1~~TRINITY_DN5689_c0_g1_i2.p1  ORF type:complete len:101 (+),score=5.87 TRINITY_DN5689_c0_g1_i2:60-362(+)
MIIATFLLTLHPTRLIKNTFLPSSFPSFLLPSYNGNTGKQAVMNHSLLSCCSMVIPCLVPVPHDSFQYFLPYFFHSFQITLTRIKLANGVTQKNTSDIAK